MTELYQSPHSLKPHPVNGRVYGEAELPEEFLNSVQKLGIIEPIVIRSNNTIISGHRRWAAALKLELKTVPVRTVTFDDELDEIETLIESNRQRVKTVSQIAAEGMELQKVEAERAKRRQGARTDLDNLPANLPESGESAEHVAESLGISTTQWKKLKTIFQKAQSGDAEAKELMKALDAGDISVHKAYRKVRDQLSEEKRRHDEERKTLTRELNAAKQELKAGAAPKLVEKVIEKPVVREVVREVVPEATQARLKDLEAQVRKTNANEQYLRNLEDRKVKLQNEIMTLKEQATKDRVTANIEDAISFCQKERFVGTQVLEMAERGELTLEQIDLLLSVVGEISMESTKILNTLQGLKSNFKRGGALRAL